MDRPPDPSRDAEQAIREALRAIRGSRQLSYRRQAEESGTTHAWLRDFDAGTYGYRLYNAAMEARKRGFATAYPELLPDLVALSLAWLPDAARARLTLAWAPAASGDGE